MFTCIFISGLFYLEFIFEEELNFILFEKYTCFHLHIFQHLLLKQGIDTLVKAVFSSTIIILAEVTDR